ncbi:MAG: MarR family transcriptional regulator [Herpetosiphonaceae bacterium]|nr:MarR family transcriptional regulator [Herpetosiphonaceae bacterium]
MVNARDCARLLLETLPIVRRGVREAMRLQKVPVHEPLTMDQVRLLKILRHESHSLGELATRHGVTASTMSRSVDILVRRGWVSRTSDPADRRQVILQLTDGGRGAHAEMDQHAEEAITLLIEELDDLEREKLFSGLEVLHALLERKQAEDAGLALAGGGS